MLACKRIFCGLHRTIGSSCRVFGSLFKKNTNAEMATAIEFNHVGKQYRLGLVSTGTLSHDINRWWQTAILRREDPYLKIGDVNDRSAKADSEYVWALRDIDFRVEQGDVVGIIGKNGAGKSTLLKLLSKVTAPTVGTIRARGRIASLLEVGTGFHSEMTGRENIYMNGAILGMTKAEIDRKLDEIVDFSGCEKYIDTPVKRYSSGMMVRLGFAVAAFLDPEILVVDEVLAVGDAEFQKKAIGKMQEVSQGQGRTVLFVSHNMASIEKLCTTGLMLENGQIKLSGDVHDVVDCYLRDNEDGVLVREGSGALRFDEYSINKDILRLGEDLEVTMQLTAHRDIDRWMLHVNIYRDNGHYMAHIINEDDAAFEVHRLRKGETYRFKCTIHDVNLGPGRYSINLWAGDAFEQFDWLKECMSFSVRQDELFLGRETVYKEDAAMAFRSSWNTL